MDGQINEKSKMEMELENTERDLKTSVNYLRASEEFARRLQIAAAYKGPDEVVHISEILRDLKEKEKLESFRAKSNIPKLDEIVGDFREGQLVIVSASTGQGKTSFCKTLTKNFNQQNIQSLWFSFEVPPLEFAENFPGIPNYVVPRQLRESNISWVEKKIVEGLAKFHSKIVFIDHLHYLTDLKQFIAAKNTSILIGYILRDLKKIALYYKVMIVLVAHLKKFDSVMELPTIDDLRDSSFIGQESDIVMLLWRKPLPQNREDKIGKLPPQWTNQGVISVVKNRRTGKLGFVKVVYVNNEFVEEAPVDLWNS